MQPVLDDAELAALATAKAQSLETLPYTEDQFRTEVSAMVEIAKARSVLEVGSAVLGDMPNAVSCPLDRLGEPSPADLTVSFKALDALSLEAVDAVLGAMAEKAARNVFVIVRIRDWARKEVQRQFWVDRIGKYFGLDSVEMTDHEILILARNRLVCSLIQGKGALEEERAGHMEHAYLSGNPPLDEVPAHDGILHIACYGPSLIDTAEGMRGQDVLTTSGGHDLLLGMGIAVKWHAESDPREERTKFGKPNQTVQYLIASCCHPSLFDTLKGYDVRIWHNYNGDKYDAARDKIGGFQVQAGSVTGLAAIVLGYALGYRKFTIHGMDCSYRGDARHAGTHPGKVQKRMTVRVGDAATGEEFQTSGQMISAAREFLHLRSRMPDCQFENLGRGLLQSMLAYEDAARQAA